MKNGRLGVGLAFGAIALAGVLAGCGGSAEGASEQAAAAAEGTPSSAAPTRVINVVVEQATPGSFAEDIALTGTVEAARDVTVSAEEGGVVRELLVELGSSVAEGQAIARIDDAVLLPQVERARAEARYAEDTWQRRRRLFEDDGVGSELAYLEARLLSEQAAAQLQVMEQRLLHTVVRAPYAGVVEERLVEVGTMVSTGSPVARILDVSRVTVAAGVPERYALDVRPGARVRVTFDALNGEVFEGSIQFVGSAVNPRNRTFPVEFSIPNSNRAIKPEMVAEVSLLRRVEDDALAIPQDAVVRLTEGDAVYVIRAEGDQEVAEARYVELGLAQDNRVTISSGIAPGDRVVVVGQQEVTDGDVVRVVEAR
jgi:membrane fusion protein (multidrug efflux system)